MAKVDSVQFNQKSGLIKGKNGKCRNQSLFIIMKLEELTIPKNNKKIIS